MGFEYRPIWGSDLPLNENRCKSVVHGPRGSRQCSRKPKSDGWCGQHHPRAIGERSKKSDEKRRERMAEQEKRRIESALRRAALDQLRAEIARREAESE